MSAPFAYSIHADLQAAEGWCPICREHACGIDHEPEQEEMETKAYTTIDRKAQGWPSGPWDGEPDKMQWPDAATGLPCLAVRHPDSGHWCGYVGVAPGHPFHGKEYNDVDLDTHCGLTFSDACSPGETESRGICHVAAPGEPDHVWWFGFDCAHCYDWSPRDEHYAQRRDEPCFKSRLGAFGERQYRTLEYVRAQCAEIAAQLVAHHA